MGVESITIAIGIVVSGFATLGILSIVENKRINMPRLA